MFKNLEELMKGFCFTSVKEFSIYDGYDTRLSRFSFGFVLDGKHYYQGEVPENPTGLIVVSSCDETDALNKEHILSFPFSEEMLRDYTEQVLRDNIEEKLIERFGRCTEKCIEHLLEYIDDKAVESAIVDEGQFEHICRSIDNCHFDPSLDDDQWNIGYTGSGLMINDDGVFGVLSHYDGMDWDHDRFSLLDDNACHEFFLSLNSLIETPFNEVSYASWILENKEDPLMYFSATHNDEDALIQHARNIVINNTVNLPFDDVMFLIEQERNKQKELAFKGNTKDFDSQLSCNDFIALSISYLGRSTQKSFRNVSEKQDYRANIIKAIALLSASLESQGSALSNSAIDL